jgi:hypothetical protein
MEETWVRWRRSSFFSPHTNIVRVPFVQKMRKCDFSLATVALAPACTGLLSMPLEVVAVIADKLFQMDTRATRLMRVAKDFIEPVKRVRDDLLRRHFAWWTGSEPPLRPLYSKKPTLPSYVDAEVAYHLRVQGASTQDLQDLLQHDAWVNNFNIVMVLKVVSYPQDIFLGPMGPSDVPCVFEHNSNNEMRVLDPTLLHALRFLNGASSPPGFWSQASVLTNLLQASTLCLPMNLDNNHWVALRASRETNVVEVFLYFDDNSPWEQQRAQHYTQMLINWLLHVNFFKSPPEVRFLRNPAWRQCDASSCGLITLVILISLIQGRRLSVDMSFPEVWRNHFCTAIVARCSMKQVRIRTA